MRSAAPVPAWFLMGLVLVLLGQASFAAQRATGLGMFTWVFGIAVIVWPSRGDDEWPPSIVADGQALDAPPWSSARTLVPGTAALVMAAVLWHEQRMRPLHDARPDLVALWVISMMLAIFALWRPRDADRLPWYSALRTWWEARRVDVFVVAGLVLAAGGLRLINLQSYPRSFNGDEAAFAVLSRRMLEGEIQNPFGVGYLSHPLLWNVVQAVSMATFGVNVAGARLPSALAGAAAVGVAYALVLRLTGRRSTALAAGVLLATLHVHIYWSRSALPNGWTAASALLVIYVLDRALASRRPVGLLATGIVLGLAQYFYFASRILLPVVAGVLVIVAVDDCRRRSHRWHAVRSAAARGALVVTGFTLAVLPQLAYYSMYSYDFDSRSRSVSIFSSGWLTQEAARTGDHPVVILIRQFSDAAFVPFSTAVVGQYRGDPPYVGWSIAVLSAVGLGLVTIRVTRGGAWTGLALLFWLSAVGVATTVETNTASRWVTMSTVICVLAALGLDVVVRAVQRSTLAPRRVVGALVVVVVGVTAAVNLHRYFRDDDQVEVYGDSNTEIVDHLARTLRDDAGPDTVYLAGAPRLWYAGFANFAFRAPDVVGVDLARPLTASDEVPGIQGPTIFVFVPERLAELEFVRSRHPNGELTVIPDSEGGTLYAAYEVSP